ncbi:MAG: hypothetical protein ABIU54_08930 [Candidatus Eisenbacteria bacterium]
MMIIRRSVLSSLALVALLGLLASCAKKADDTSMTASDSLLSASPIETTDGLQPDTTFQSQPEPTPEPIRTPIASAPPRRTTARPRPTPRPVPVADNGVTIPAGTAVKVGVDARVSSESATVGSSWSGTVKDAVIVGSMAPFPAGSIVHGVVEGVQPAAKGSRAFLVLRMTSIEANGRSQTVHASTDSIIAGSTRARNLGAIAGTAAAGALIGKAVGGGGKGALIGGLLGGAAATGTVAASKGYQVVLKEGTELVFRVDSDTRLRL